MTSPRRLVVGITGATGALYAVRLLQALRGVDDVESHLVVSASGVLNIKYELDIGRHDVYALADHVHSLHDVGATFSRGAFEAAGMVLVPCSLRTLAPVAPGLPDQLITPAPDVTLSRRSDR